MAEEELLFDDARWERATQPGDNLAGLIPMVPFIPHEDPPAIHVVYNYAQLKAYRLVGQPYIVRANYDQVEMMIEAGILKKHDHEYIEWLSWIEANL